MRKHITFLELENWEIDYLKNKLKDLQNVNIEFYNCPLNDELLPKISNTNVLAIFIYSQINKEVIDKLPNLEYITTMSTGYDHIDTKECAKRNILVSNVPRYGENTVAEHTFALILALARKIPQSLEKVRRYDFSLDGLRGFDLKGKTIGIVGLGSIGQHVAKIAKGFEMKIIAYDPAKSLDFARSLGVELTSFQDLLTRSDIISLHAPYNQSTHHIINQQNIHLIKKGAYLINTARGGLVETQALVKALDQGLLAGAGLDVLEEELAIKEEKELLCQTSKNPETLNTLLQNHILIQDPRVIITPHNAFNSKEALQRILDTTAENIKNYILGNLINQIS